MGTQEIFYLVISSVLSSVFGGGLLYLVTIRKQIRKEKYLVEQEHEKAKQDMISTSNEMVKGLQSKIESYSSMIKTMDSDAIYLNKQLDMVRVKLKEVIKVNERLQKENEKLKVNNEILRKEHAELKKKYTYLNKSYNLIKSKEDARK